MASYVAKFEKDDQETLETHSTAAAAHNNVDTNRRINDVNSKEHEEALPKQVILTVIRNDQEEKCILTYEERKEAQQRAAIVPTLYACVVSTPLVPILYVCVVSTPLTPCILKKISNSIFLSIQQETSLFQSQFGSSDRINLIAIAFNCSVIATTMYRFGILESSFLARLVI